jgi:uncharacterized membrane protein
MSSNKTDDAVVEYLHEVELRLAGLPLLQRRELLADLRAHIAGERLERSAHSEGEVLEILERLGSPEEVAAAAYAEAGPLPTTIRPAQVGTPTRSRLLLGAAVVAIIIFALLVVGIFFAKASSSGGKVSPVPAAPSAQR